MLQPCADKLGPCSPNELDGGDVLGWSMLETANGCAATVGLKSWNHVPAELEGCDELGRRCWNRQSSLLELVF